MSLLFFLFCERWKVCTVAYSVDVNCRTILEISNYWDKHFRSTTLVDDSFIHIKHMHYVTIQVNILIVTDYFHKIHELILDIPKSGTQVTYVSLYFSYMALINSQMLWEMGNGEYMVRWKLTSMSSASFKMMQFKQLMSWELLCMGQA